MHLFERQQAMLASAITHSPNDPRACVFHPRCIREHFTQHSGIAQCPNCGHSTEAEAGQNDEDELTDYEVVLSDHMEDMYDPESDGSDQD
jgi:hypothetical protein